MLPNKAGNDLAASCMERPRLFVGVALTALCLMLGDALLSNRGWWMTSTGKEILGVHDGRGDGEYIGAERSEGVIWSRAVPGKPKPRVSIYCPKEVDPADYVLTKVQRLAVDNYLLVTYTNYNFLDFAKNWVSHVRELGITAYAVIALDNATLGALVSEGVNAFTTGASLNSGNIGWFTPGFRELQVGKANLLVELSMLELEVVLSDVDTVWLKNPIEFCQRYPRADILIASQQLWSSTHDGGLEDWTRSADAMLNIGILVLRGTDIVAEFLGEYRAIVVHNNTSWDQEVFNTLLRDGLIHSPNDSDRLVAAYRGSLTLGVLPISLFTSGHPYFIQRLQERLGVKPYVAHVIHALGQAAKRHRLRNRLLWHDDPGYFDTNNGFVAFDFEILETMLKNAKPKEDRIDISLLTGHFDLVHHQLLQLRNAFAIAQVLNRSLIIPQTWCGVDQSWGEPHSGCWPGSHFELPFPCPLDHILLLDPVVQGLDETEFGPHVDIREASFLANPRLPAKVNASRLSVSITGSGLNGNDTISLEPYPDEHQIRALFAEASHYKIIYFSSMLQAFGNFTDATDAKAFDKRMKRYTGFFCCTMVNGVTGMVDYDPWFDKIPHIDRFGRVWEANWKPTLNPA